MGAALEILKNKLFDADAINTGNIKLYPGTNREATPEDIAKEISQSLTRLAAGSTSQIEED